MGLMIIRRFLWNVIAGQSIQRCYLMVERNVLKLKFTYRVPE